MVKKDVKCKIYIYIFNIFLQKLDSVVMICCSFSLICSIFLTSKNHSVPVSCACLLKTNNICNISVFLLVSPAGALSNWTSSLGNREQTNYRFLLFCFYIPSLLPFFSNVGLHPCSLFYSLSCCSPAIWGFVPPEIPSSLPLTNLFSLQSSSAADPFATHELSVYLSWYTWCTCKNNNYY